jgi:hypothetical protein
MSGSADNFPGMHRSRLYGIFVDVPLADTAAATAFWPAALGATSVKPGTAEDPYWGLHGVLPDHLIFEIQAVDDAARYHLDIETDDVAAEVARLVGLGATVHHEMPSWTIMKDPAGNIFCVVPVQSPPAVFEAHANRHE